MKLLIPSFAFVLLATSSTCVDPRMRHRMLSEIGAGPYVRNIAMPRMANAAKVPASVQSKSESLTSGDSAVRKVTGDFNGDGRRETMWLEAPELDTVSGWCVDTSCTAFIRFSDPSLHPIPVKNCIGGVPVNLADLNGDKSDEIGLSPEWFTSCWASYYVWRRSGASWTYAVKPFSTHCIQFEDYTGPTVKKDKAHPGKVIIRYSESGDADILVKTKSVPLQ